MEQSFPLLLILMKVIPTRALSLKKAAKGILEPAGKVHHYALATIGKWYLKYKKYDFYALVPKAKDDSGMLSISWIMSLKNISTPQNG